MFRWSIILEYVAGEVAAVGYNEMWVQRQATCVRFAQYGLPASRVAQVLALINEYHLLDSMVANGVHILVKQIFVFV